MVQPTDFTAAGEGGERGGAGGVFFFKGTLIVGQRLFRTDTDCLSAY